jgi:hypothetical protein
MENDHGDAVIAVAYDGLSYNDDYKIDGVDEL